MTQREKEILERIKENPLVSQKELADQLNITRSSVAVHITNLQKKGYIAGKGYIVKEDPYICVIGGSNVDIQGFPKNELLIHDSNPGKVKISLGGVGRNIAENTALLEMQVKFITALGSDIYGENILKDSKSKNIDMSYTLISKMYPTSTYLSILNEERDMHIAVSDMDIIDEISISYLRDKDHIIKNAQICLVDCNLNKDVIEYIAQTYSEYTPIFLDTVSSSKALKAKDVIGKFHTIKPNLIEAQRLSGIEINDLSEISKIGNYFYNLGVKQIFISLSKEGTYYFDGKEEGILKNPEIIPINTTGAGDAFISGLIYSYINHYSSKESAKFAMGCAIMALSHEDTINPNLSISGVKKLIREMISC